MPSVALIVNPFASSVTEARARDVHRALSAAGEVTVLRTTERGHATELAREIANQADAIVVYAGDGGFNEVLNGIEGPVPIGFVPGGGKNVLSRALGLPARPAAAAQRLAQAIRDGRTTRISVGRVNGRRFAFSAGVGFDAALVRRVDARGRTSEGRRPGDLAFVVEAARLLAERRGRFEPAVEVVGFGPAAFALVANADPYTYAGPFPLHVAPEARFELGLDLVAPERVRPATVARLLGYAFAGRGQSRAAGVHYGHDLDRIELRCEARLPLQADGEDLGDVDQAVFEAERGAVKVLV